jgi:hypothetical protein
MSCDVVFSFLSKILTHESFIVCVWCVSVLTLFNLVSCLNFYFSILMQWPPLGALIKLLSSQCIAVSVKAGIICNSILLVLSDRLYPPLLTGSNRPQENLLLASCCPCCFFSLPQRLVSSLLVFGWRLFIYLKNLTVCFPPLLFTLSLSLLLLCVCLCVSSIFDKQTWWMASSVSSFESEISCPVLRPEDDDDDDGVEEEEEMKMSSWHLSRERGTGT